MTVTHVPALVDGAGVGGLAASALLARHGVASPLVDKRDEVFSYPKARNLSFRSMEDPSPEPAAQYRPQSKSEPILLGATRARGGEVRYGSSSRSTWTRPASPRPSPTGSRESARRYVPTT